MAREKQILDLNAFDRTRKTTNDQALEKALDQRFKSFGSGAVLFFDEPIRMASAKGGFMYDETGKAYLDVYNNVPSVGHCHPRVVEAIQRQAGLLNTHTRYLVEIVDRFAERLLATFPAPLDKLYLTCTGSEANDLALRIAEAATGGHGFIVTRSAYHGNTAAVTAVSPSSWPGQSPPPHIRIVDAPDTYRKGEEAVATELAEAIETAIADLKRNGIRLAGFIADTVFSSDGIYTHPPGFLAKAVGVVRAYGGLFIADEVQPGFGRTGESLWGFSRHGLVPDLCTLGKPMGNGFPMGGVVLSEALQDQFTSKFKYFNTFGGNPVAAAAGLAVLDVIRDEHLIKNAQSTGAYLRGGLHALSNRYEAIGDVRGSGLFIGLEFVTSRRSKNPDTALASAVINAMRHHGILIGAAGAHGNILKIRPPLCFDRTNAEQFIATCDLVLSDVTGTAFEPSLRSKRSRPRVPARSTNVTKTV